MNRRPPKPLTMPELEKAKALNALGKSYHAIGCELNRDSKTIKKWLSEPETAKEIQVIKGELSGQFESMAKRMLASITDEDIQKINAYQRVVSSGIATDKMRLLKGESIGTDIHAIMIGVFDRRQPQEGAIPIDKQGYVVVAPPKLNITDSDSQGDEGSSK